jgi:hypothetical protein
MTSKLEITVASTVGLGGTLVTLADQAIPMLEKIIVAVVTAVVSAQMTRLLTWLHTRYGGGPPAPPTPPAGGAS